MTKDERDELVLELSRSLWSLHMTRTYVNKMDKEIKTLNLASAPRSTEIIPSHGHATPTEANENDEIMVSNTEVNLAEGQYERSVEDTLNDENVLDIPEYELSVEDTLNNENVLDIPEVEDSIHLDMLQSTTMPMGVLDVPTADDSSDLGSLELNEANGRDGDLATADLQPGHSSIIRADRRMMMNTNDAQLVRSRCTVGPEHGGDRAPMSGSQANHGWAASLQGPRHPSRTSRPGQFGWDQESGSGK